MYNSNKWQRVNLVNPLTTLAFVALSDVKVQNVRKVNTITWKDYNNDQVMYVDNESAQHSVRSATLSRAHTRSSTSPKCDGHTRSLQINPPLKDK